MPAPRCIAPLAAALELHLGKDLASDALGYCFGRKQATQTLRGPVQCQIRLECDYGRGGRIELYLHRECTEDLCDCVPTAIDVAAFGRQACTGRLRKVIFAEGSYSPARPHESLRGTMVVVPGVVQTQFIFYDDFNNPPACVAVDGGWQLGAALSALGHGKDLDA